MPLIAPHITERGYVFVVQDVRGKFRSEGEAMPYTHEVDDGYDTVEWVSRQAWSNGRVGMFGDSYYGYTQWAAVASGHSALKAIVPAMTCADLGKLSAWWQDDVAALFRAIHLVHYWTGPLEYEFDVDCARRPLIEAFEEFFAAVGTRSLGFDALLRLGNKRVAAAYPAGHPFDRLGIPVLHSVGWFDVMAPVQMREYMTLRTRPDTAPRPCST